MRQQFIAIGSRLRGVPEVLTLGVKPNFMDYTPGERELALSAPIILYPTLTYAQLFTTLGRPIFPSLETHLYADEKIKQTTLFYMLGVPHPRTRFYYSRHHNDIVNDFSFPCIGKIARRSSQGRGVFMLRNLGDLEAYLRVTRVAYLQEYLPHKRDLRVVVINYRRKCRFDDAGLDLILSGGRWYVIEANMKYGRKGLKARGMDLKEILRQKLLSGEIR
jgi:ribosomal protein S6--L-glutamate ligase